jgi:hypothetical protein
MSMIRDLVQRTAAPGSQVMRQILAHLGAWLTLLVRPPVARADGRRAVPRWGILAIIGLGATVSVAAAMVFLDAWAIAQQRNFPAWVVQIFERVTDFGKSGWFLWPAALLVIAAAALAGPALGRTVNMVILSLVVRRVRFLRYRYSGAGGLDREAPDRAGSAIRSGTVSLRPILWRPDYAPRTDRRFCETKPIAQARGDSQAMEGLC